MHKNENTFGMAGGVDGLATAGGVGGGGGGEETIALLDDVRGLGVVGGGGAAGRGGMGDCLNEEGGVGRASGGEGEDVAQSFPKKASIEATETPSFLIFCRMAPSAMSNFRIISYLLIDDGAASTTAVEE